MSRYLITSSRIPNVRIMLVAEVRELLATRSGVPADADGDRSAARRSSLSVRPCSGWLRGLLARARGFVRRRTSSALETSRPGIFAVGDVHSGSAKRVAAAVGEGAMAIRLAFERTRPG